MADAGSPVPRGDAPSVRAGSAAPEPRASGAARPLGSASDRAAALRSGEDQDHNRWKPEAALARVHCYSALFGNPRGKMSADAADVVLPVIEYLAAYFRWTDAAPWSASPQARPARVTECGSRTGVCPEPTAGTGGPSVRVFLTGRLRTLGDAVPGPPGCLSLHTVCGTILRLTAEQALLTFSLLVLIGLAPSPEPLRHLLMTQASSAIPPCDILALADRLAPAAGGYELILASRYLRFERIEQTDPSERLQGQGPTDKQVQAAVARIAEGAAAEMWELSVDGRRRQLERVLTDDPTNILTCLFVRFLGYLHAEPDASGSAHSNAISRALSTSPNDAGGAPADRVAVASPADVRFLIEFLSARHFDEPQPRYLTSTARMHVNRPRYRTTWCLRDRAALRLAERAQRFWDRRVGIVLSELLGRLPEANQLVLAFATEIGPVSLARLSLLDSKEPHDEDSEPVVHYRI
jgi:hypothetical protein